MAIKEIAAGLDVGANIGEAIGKGMTNYIFHYKKSAYEERIEALSASVDRLEEYRAELYDLKTQISGFWADEIGESTAQRLQETIENTEKQMQTSKDLIAAIRAAINALGKTKEELHAKVEEVANMFRIFDA